MTIRKGILAEWTLSFLLLYVIYDFSWSADHAINLSRIFGSTSWHTFSFCLIHMPLSDCLSRFCRLSKLLCRCLNYVFELCMWQNMLHL